MRILTLGVYGRDEKEFFDLIGTSRIDLFVDVRRLRGLRGATYKFANSEYLQKQLARLKIKYWHAIDLSPSNATRALQDREDGASGTLKRDRASLAAAFVKAYAREVLRKENLDAAVTELQQRTVGIKNPTICLFCVERNQEACHRSLLADALARRMKNATVKHL
jgi:uncharacterized protein (DUF488 family)